jgi:hypothetical protein
MLSTHCKNNEVYTTPRQKLKVVLVSIFMLVFIFRYNATHRNIVSTSLHFLFCSPFWKSIGIIYFVRTSGPALLCRGTESHVRKLKKPSPDPNNAFPSGASTPDEALTKLIPCERDQATCNQKTKQTPAFMYNAMPR